MSDGGDKKRDARDEAATKHVTNTNVTSPRFPQGRAGITGTERIRRRDGEVLKEKRRRRRREFEERKRSRKELRRKEEEKEERVKEGREGMS